MRKLSVIGVLFFASAMLAGTSGWCATIEPGQGALSINHGDGFQPINSRVDAAVGDAVMVGPGGGATIVYDDGCKVAVAPGVVATVAPLSPCASESFAQDNNSNDNYALDAAMITGVLTVWGVDIYLGTKSSNNNNPASP